MIRWPVSLLIGLLAMSAGAQLFRGGVGDGYRARGFSGLVSGLPAPSIYFGGDADGADFDEVHSLADGSSLDQLAILYRGGARDGADVDEVQSLADGSSLDVLASLYQGGNRDGFDIRGSGPADLDTLYDQDMDLMPDYWEADNDLNFHNPNDAGLDPDGDQANSLDEWIADTDPQDIASVFAIEITLGPIPTESTLGFPSSTARVYRVEYRLTFPTNDWFNLGPTFPGDGGWMLHDVGHPDTKTLYRMKVGLPQSQRWNATSGRV